jgi:hypothetical protein
MFAHKSILLSIANEELSHGQTSETLSRTLLLAL